MKRTIILLVLALSFNSIVAKQKIVEASTYSTIDSKTAELLLHDYRSKANLYLCDSPADIEHIRKAYPDDIKKSIEIAKQVQQKYFIFRYEWDMEKTNIPYQFQDNIDWTLIPFGDEEWCFMLNRHRYWQDLGKAYLFTKDEAFAKTWVGQVSDWIQHNPLSNEQLHKLSWRRIEAGIRCENWIKSFEYFKNSPSISPDFFALFLNSLVEHATYINSSFSDFSQTSNWGVLEYQGLLNVALFMPKFEQSQQWKNEVLQKLATCAKIQILSDGTQWEQSPMYHNEVFHCLSNVNYLTNKQAIAIPQILVDKSKDMAMANIKWQKPNFHQPLIGDSDDSDLRGLLTFASIVFNDSLIKSRAYQECDYENSFLFTSEQQVRFKNQIAKNPDFCSVYLQSSGDMIMRSSWQESANYMNIRLKRLGCGHAHDDIFHLSLFANGKDYLVDGGRYTYVESEGRKQLKNSFSHNSLSVDDQPNSIYDNTWGNSYNADSRGIYTQITPQYDYAEADNTAYMRLEDPVLTTRRVLFLKPGLWLLFDSFLSKGEHKYAQHFNFADKNVKLSENQIQTTYANNNLTIKALKPAMAKVSDGQWSPEYNLLVENSNATFYRNSQGFDSFITALYFPEQGSITIQKIPVFDRKNKEYNDKIAEAVEIKYGSKEYILLVVYQLDTPATPFYKIKNEIVTGKVVLLEKQGEGYIQSIIKE